MFAIFVFFYITRIAKLERKKDGKSRVAKVKDAASKVGEVLEDTLVRMDDSPRLDGGADLSMNTANFAIFQGAGLETLDSRGLGREWTRRGTNLND